MRTNPSRLVIIPKSFSHIYKMPTAPSSRLEEVGARATIPRPLRGWDEGRKAGGQTKREDTFKGLSEKETLRKEKGQASNKHAYALEEAADMLDKLPEPARTVCAVAAFTVLARSELKGLKWEDYDGETINVRWKIWNDHVGAPKTEAREAGVYVVPLLQRFWQSTKRVIRL